MHLEIHCGRVEFVTPSSMRPKPETAASLLMGNVKHEHNHMRCNQSYFDILLVMSAGTDAERACFDSVCVCQAGRPGVLAADAHARLG